MSGFIAGIDLEQTTLFPERLEDWIGEDHLVRVVDLFVDELDLAGLGFTRHVPARTGRPGYHPAVLLKLFIYGYLNRIPSSRRLEREGGRNVELMWLTGRLVPDHKTIADFRRDNSAAIGRTCAQFVELCRRIGTLKGACVAIDGSKFKAVNSRDRNFTKGKIASRLAHLEADVQRYIDEMVRIDRQEADEARATKVANLARRYGRIRQEIARLKAMDAALSPAKKRSMIHRGHPELSISQQCNLVQLSRSAFYYTPVGIDAATLSMMKEIDRVFTKYPFFGSRQIAAYLRREGIVVGRHRVRRLMAKMGLEAIYKRPRTSQPHPQHSVYPYLLRKMVIDRPNQVWCADITFVPVKNGYLYLVAIMDWATRKVLSWRLSNTMHADFCVEALNEAISQYGPPEIMNTDQGSQFTESAWITTLTEAGVRISMDGRGRYLDNIFIERLWRSLKQEAIYLEEISDGFQARRVVKDWMAFYNTKRPHSALDRLTPDDAYWAGLEQSKAA